MKNPEKQFKQAMRLRRKSAVLVLGKEGLHWMPTNPILYKQAEDMSLEAQEEMGRQNKRKINETTNPQH